MVLLELVFGLDAIDHSIYYSMQLQIAPPHQPKQPDYSGPIARMWSRTLPSTRRDVTANPLGTLANWLFVCPSVSRPFANCKPSVHRAWCRGP